MNEELRSHLSHMLCAVSLLAGCSADEPIRVGSDLPLPGQAPPSAAGTMGVGTPGVGVETAGRSTPDIGLGSSRGSAPDLQPVQSGAPASASAAGSGAHAPSCEHRDMYRAEQQTLTIYTLFDESGSMLFLWPAVTEAFTAFVRDPRSAGINLGLKFFGLDCDPTFYSKPDVPIAPLPQNADAIAQELEARIPLAQTPSVPALEGAVIALRSHAANHPDEKTVVLLVTDASSGFGEGMDIDCYSTVAKTSEVAATAYAATPSIETYVLGLGDPAGLDTLSMAGGTGTAVVADTSASDKMIEAMHEIRKRALPCDYALPTGAENYPDLVNLEVSGPDGGAPAVLPRFASLEKCHPVSGGWYYDDPAAPSRIMACPVTCETLGAATEVQVVLGCPSVIGPQ